MSALAWQDQAACRGHRLDFTDGRTTREHVAVCCRCPVMDECLAWALEWERFLSRDYVAGTAGGHSAPERLRLVGAAA